MEGDVEMTVGFRILNRTRCVSAETVEAFRQLPVANVGDCMNRLFAGGPRIRPINPGASTVAGPALTVRTCPGDNLLLHRAIDIAEPGDVIVVDAGGDLTTAIMGEIMAAIALRRQVEAIVIDGAIRDAEEIRRMGLPLYAAGVTLRGPYKNGPGEINTTIALGGMTIEPGDLIIADGDGVLCIPFDETGSLLEAARKKHAAEQEELRKIAEGTDDRSWVMNALSRNGCEFA
jgi:RraA family protein